MSNNNCPICDLELLDQGSSGMAAQYRCRRCGSFMLTHTARTMLGLEFSQADPRRAVLSHAVRKMQRQNQWPTISNKDYTDILLKSKLPKPTEQATNLISWLGTTAPSADARVEISCEELQAIIGGQQVESVYYIGYYLQNKGLLSFERTDNAKATPPLKFQMTVVGWEEFDRLQRDNKQSRTAFMAMKFGDAELNDIVETVFRPAVAQAGFELKVLTDAQPAGLIDDNLRVEIRRSRFLLADITHMNLGAYWEAGFAEGLGKPVIYTCKESAFKAGASHFDTNHHLTVLWANDKDQVIRNLTATIRATLPAEAKLND